MTRILHGIDLIKCERRKGRRKKIYSKNRAKHSLRDALNFREKDEYIENFAIKLRCQGQCRDDVPIFLKYNHTHAFSFINLHSVKTSSRTPLLEKTCSNVGMLFVASRCYLLNPLALSLNFMTQ